MHEWMLTASSWVLHYVVRSTMMTLLLGVLALCCDRLLREVGPKAQHRMWVATLAGSVLLPMVPLTALLPSGDTAAHGALGAATVTYRLIAAPVERWTASPVLCGLFAGAYAVFVLWGLARLTWQAMRTRAMARRARPLMPDRAVHSLLEQAALRFAIRAPEVRVSSAVRGPVVLGLRRPLLLVPDGFFAMQEDADIAAALAHECAHVARRDFAKSMIYAVASTAIGYHPACWRMQRRIAETRELICDEIAAAAVGDRPEYAASLLRLATTMAQSAAPALNAIGVFDANILEERIMRLTIDLPKISTIRRLAIVSLTACALAGGALSAAAMSLELLPPASETSGAVHGKVYKVGDGVSVPVLEHVVDAEFPDAQKKAGKNGLQGVSEIGLIVDSKGMPQGVHVLRSLAPDFDKKAMEAVEQYRFKPGMRKGKPVAVSVKIEVNFHRY